MDTIKINVPTFIRLLELVREDIKSDPDLHDLAEIITHLSEQGIIGMDDYDTIIDYMNRVSGDHSEYNTDDDESEIQDLRKLSGLEYT